MAQNKSNSFSSDTIFEKNHGKEQVLLQRLLTRPEFSMAVESVLKQLSDKEDSTHINPQAVYIGTVTTVDLSDGSQRTQIEMRYYHYADPRGDILIGSMTFLLPLTFGGSGDFIYQGFDFKI